LASVWPVLKILLSLSISGLLHFYVWRRLVRDAELGRRAQRAIAIVMAAMWISIPVTTSARLWAPRFASAFAWVAMPWMGFVGLVAVALLFLEVPHQVVRRRTDLSRRAFLARVTGGTAGVVAGGSVIAGMAEARGEH
jgi:hypothetical protein